MSLTETRISIPGEWIDRHGRPRQKGSIWRIAVVKPDHIGDLLIASRAFGLLRHFFPLARIELICGPWNVALARRLGLFDDVHGVDLFHEISGQQQDASVARTIWRDGIATLESLKLGSFDLAIDMRYDRDSRPLLLSVDARIYAGYGAINDYPFLDISLPTTVEANPRGRSSELFLTGRNFHRVAGHMDPSGVPTRGSGVILSERSSIDLDLLVKGAKSPAACGTVASDTRELGIALRQVRIAPVVEEGSPPSWQALKLRPHDPAITLISGWAAQEDWGVWGEGRLCRLSVALPPSRGEKRVRLDLSLLGHVNKANPLIECSAHTSGDAPNATVMFKFPTNQAELSVEASRVESMVRLASEPFRLLAGCYRGSLRVLIPMTVTPDMSLTVVLRGLNSAASLMRRTASWPTLRTGLCDIPFECDVETGDEPLSLEVEAPNAHAWEGARIEMLTIECLEPMKLNGPIGHMEQHASMLALRVAMEFSDVAPFGGDEIPEALTSRIDLNSESEPGDPRKQIELWKSEGFCVVGIALGCNSEIRKWPLNYFIELARNLLALGPVKLLFIGGPADSAEAEEACNALGLDTALHSSCGKTRLPELGRFLQPLDLFIGSNTGTTHFAGRVGVRTIGIYSGTNHPREWGPIGENASWVTRDEKCAPCSLTDINDCRFGHVCLRNLLPTDVLPIVVPEILRVLTERRTAFVP